MLVPARCTDPSGGHEAPSCGSLPPLAGFQGYLALTVGGLAKLSGQPWGTIAGRKSEGLRALLGQGLSSSADHWMSKALGSPGGSPLPPF